ncbi:MAG TPA: helix-turn-helix domain-containing protein [Pedococcus sp.]|uniref:helix-turn-helix domain-containing protein n=1 Tax=Pedococcus sp. TaxID=2860345 RepID=UPI002F93B36B
MASPLGSRWALTGTGDLEARRHLEVSQRLRERRRLLGLTQKQVTSRLGRLGVASTNKSLSSLEHGAGLDVAKLPELAAALECTVTWLLGLTDDPHRWEPDEPAPPGPSLHQDAAEQTSGPWILGPLSPEA